MVVLWFSTFAASTTEKTWLVVLALLKNISQWEGLSHILWEKKNVPNHQPETNVEKGILVPSRPGEYLFRLMKSSSFLVPDRNNAPLTVRKRHLLAGSCPILIGQLPSWGLVKCRHVVSLLYSISINIQPPCLYS